MHRTMPNIGASKEAIVVESRESTSVVNEENPQGDESRPNETAFTASD